MAYETGTASSISDLVSALATFAVANGWTQDHLDTGAGKAAIHKNSVYVSFRWATSSPTHLGIYQALGFINTSTDPGNHTDDSGNGVVSGTDATILTGRCVNAIGNGPFPSYHFFQDSTPDYIHVVLQFAPSNFRHFGFGELAKIGDWTGGEYCYGHYHESGSANASLNSLGLDSTYGPSVNFGRAATLHAEGLPNQSGASKWMQIWALSEAATNPNDRAGNVKIRGFGGSRGGLIGRAIGWMRADLTTGFVPLLPIPVIYRDVSTNPDNLHLLGYQPDVRAVNIGNLVPGSEFTLGSDVWMVFPTVKKQNTGAVEESRNQGLAYKKVV